MPDPSLPSRPKEVKLFRNNRSHALRIPAEFELPGDRVMIHREGNRLIIQPVARPANIIELLAGWKKEGPLEPEDRFRILRICLQDRRIFFDPVFGSAARRVEDTDPREICNSIVVAAELPIWLRKKGSDKLSPATICWSLRKLQRHSPHTIVI